MLNFSFEGQHKWMPTKSPEYEHFLDFLHQRCQKLGLERQVFHPKKGEVLFSSADLAHGGRQQLTEGLTRKSIVTHYCPFNCDSVYSGSRQKPQKYQHNDIAFYTFDMRFEL